MFSVVSFCHSVHSGPFRPHILSILLYLYRPPMKLRETSAFNCVCLSTRGRRCHVTITHNAWDLPVGPSPSSPPHGHGSSLYRDCPHPHGHGSSLYKDHPPPEIQPYCTVPPVTSGGQHCKPVQTCLLEGPHCTAPPPFLLQYWQAGGLHPAGMLSCSNRFSRISMASSSLISRAASKYYGV